MDNNLSAMNLLLPGIGCTLGVAAWFEWRDPQTDRTRLYGLMVIDAPSRGDAVDFLRRSAETTRRLLKDRMATFACVIDGVPFMQMEPGMEFSQYRWPPS